MINVLKHMGRKNIGQGMVELALVLPLFLLLLYGIFEVGRVIFMYSAVLNASRDAVRYASGSGKVELSPGVYASYEYYRNCAGIKDRAAKVSAIIDLSAANSVVISYDNGPGVDLIPQNCETLPSSTKLTLGDRVIVEVKTTFNPIVPITGFNAFQISSKSSRSVTTDLDIWKPYD